MYTKHTRTDAAHPPTDPALPPLNSNPLYRQLYDVYIHIILSVHIYKTCLQPPLLPLPLPLGRCVRGDGLLHHPRHLGLQRLFFRFLCFCVCVCVSIYVWSVGGFANTHPHAHTTYVLIHCKTAHRPPSQKQKHTSTRRFPPANSDTHHPSTTQRHRPTPKNKPDTKQKQ